MALLSIGEILDLGNGANMSAYIPYSALNYNTTGAISGISGSAIAGGVDTTVVSSIASSYVESSISSKADKSALDKYLEKSASSMFAPSGDYAHNSSLSSYLYASASSLFQPAGSYQTAGDYAYNSAVSAKLDASASSQFALSGDYAYNSSLTSYIPFSSVSGTNNLITAINGSAISGQGGGGATGDYLTAVIGSDRARIATAFQEDNNNRPSLLISAERVAERPTWPRMILTDWNRTTGLNHSGMLLADGFEFYQCPDSANGQVSPSGIKRARLDPTNLQFLVNTAISSDGHSANYGRSGLWFFPTGGSALSISISSDTSVGPFIQLNDNSGLSGRMSVSSIGYWNNKLDTTAQVVTATAGNGTYVTSINGMEISGQGGGGGGATGDYVEKSATAVMIGSGNLAYVGGFAQGNNNTARAQCFSQGNNNTSTQTSFAQGISNTASSNGFAFGNGNGASSIGISMGGSNRTLGYGLAIGYANTASSTSVGIGLNNFCGAGGFAFGTYNSAQVNAIALGLYNSAKNTAMVFGRYNLHGDGSTSTGNSAAFAIGDGTATGARHDLMLVTKDGEITMFSSTADTVGTGIMSSIRALSANAGSYATGASVVIVNDSSLATANGVVYVVVS